MRRKVSTTMYLDPDAYDAVKCLSEATKVPAAELMRQALARFMSTRCSACGLVQAHCRLLWHQQTKCCPDCDCKP